MKTKDLTAENKLHEALKFLATHNHKGGSFDYYDEKAVANGIEDYLFRYLKSIGVDEYEHMPIVYHLFEDKYIDANWQFPLTKDSGNSPNQIKITFKGIVFINEGGYTKQKLNNSSNNERIKSLENKTFALTLLIAIGTIIAALYYANELCKFYKWCDFCSSVKLAPAITNSCKSSAKRDLQAISNN